MQSGMLGGSEDRLGLPEGEEAPAGAVRIDWGCPRGKSEGWVSDRIATTWWVGR